MTNDQSSEGHLKSNDKWHKKNISRDFIILVKIINGTIFSNSGLRIKIKFGQYCK
jgi:hypothetical protein